MGKSQPINANKNQANLYQISAVKSNNTISRTK